MLEKEIHDWLWKEYSDSLIAVSIYVKGRPYIQNARKFLWSLPKKLSTYGKITATNTAYIMTFPPTMHRGKKGVPIGVMTQYMVEGAGPDFYEALFSLLEEKKKAVSWLDNYTIANLTVFHSWDDFTKRIELEAKAITGKLQELQLWERIRQDERLLAELGG
jgi:hypothetical protein